MFKKLIPVKVRSKVEGVRLVVGEKQTAIVTSKEIMKALGSPERAEIFVDTHCKLIKVLPSDHPDTYRVQYKMRDGKHFGSPRITFTSAALEGTAEVGRVECDYEVKDGALFVAYEEVHRLHKVHNLNVRSGGTG